MRLGNDFNIFELSEIHAKKLLIQNPVISNEDLDKIKYLEHKNFKAISIPILYEIHKGVNGLEKSLVKIIEDIERQIDSGANIIILSDRGVSNYFAPIPVLLACAHVHNTFKRMSKRSKFDIVIESAEPVSYTHLTLPTKA